AHIASLEARIEALNGIVADPDLYARDRAQFEAASSALASAREELTAAEEQWLALEMRREEIERPSRSDRAAQAAGGSDPRYAGARCRWPNCKSGSGRLLYHAVEGCLRLLTIAKPRQKHTNGEHEDRFLPHMLPPLDWWAGAQRPARRMV